MAIYEKIEYVEKQSIHMIDFFVSPLDTMQEVEYHFHRSLEILLPVVGGLHIFCNGTHKRIEAGQAYIINSKDIHSVIPIFDAGYYKGYAFQIPYKILTYCNHNIDVMSFKNSNHIQKLMLPILYKIIKTQEMKEEYHFIELTELTLQLMKTLLLNVAYIKNVKDTLTDTQKDKIIKITEYIKENYQQKLKVSDIAKHFHYSYGHMEKVFKENTGTTIVDFIKNIRLIHVENALIHGYKTILEISEDVGFPNVKSLNFSFKEKHGITPKQYRNNIRKIPV
ncbi:MAG: AraC family transcriptional regulator [Coprobacillaceae bacterium]